MYPPGDAREDWRILRAFSDVLGKPLPYDTLEALRARLELINPVFARAGLPLFGATQLEGPAGDPLAVGDAPLVPAIADYYQTNAISRASLTMAECSRLYTAPLAVAAE
jgi:NADH-quinone oxidoreductase subunit G